METRDYQAVTAPDQTKFEDCFENFRGDWNFATNLASMLSG
jgi:hypothetical protein